MGAIAPCSDTVDQKCISQDVLVAVAKSLKTKVTHAPGQVPLLSIGVECSGVK